MQPPSAYSRTSCVCQLPPSTARMAVFVLIKAPLVPEAKSILKDKLLHPLRKKI